MNERALVFTVVVLSATSIYLGVRVQEKPTVVAKEVPVDRLVEKPVEVIKVVTKEVPVEVIKEVEKLVPVVLTDEERSAMNIGKRIQKGKSYTFGDHEPLIGISSFYVRVYVADNIKSLVNAEAIKSGIELELRKLGINVVDNYSADADPARVIYSIEGSFFDEETFTFADELSVHRAVILPTTKDTTWNFLDNVSVYTQNSFGRVGKSKVSTISDNYQKKLSIFLNAYLKANPRNEK